MRARCLGSLACFPPGAMHRRRAVALVAAILFAGLVNAAQLEDGQFLRRTGAINPPAPPRAAPEPEPTTSKSSSSSAPAEKPTADPTPAPAQSSGSTSKSSSSTSFPPVSSSPPSTSSPTRDTTSTTATSVSSSHTISTPRADPELGPTTPIPPTTTSSRSTAATTKTSTTPEPTPTPKPTTSSSHTTSRTSVSTPRQDDSTSKPPPAPTSAPTSSKPAASSSRPSSTAPRSSTPASESGSKEINPASHPTNDFGGSNVPTTVESLTSSPQAPAQVTSDGTALADHGAASSGLLHNRQDMILVFTFAAVIALALVGLLAWCCWRRRSRNQHVVLDEKDEAVGFRRANSTASRSSRPRPVSVSSGNTSEGGWHYTPARFAGIQPVRPTTFDAGRIAQDPFSVHRVVYPDMPTPDGGVAGMGSGRQQYTLYPDPPSPPPMSRAPAQAAGDRLSPLPPPPPMMQSGGAGTRPHSPESHYDEESVYAGLQRRPYMIERRPERRSPNAM